MPHSVALLTSIRCLEYGGEDPMKNCVLVLLCCAVGMSQMASSGRCTNQELSEWMSSSLTQIEKIQVGMTRADVQRLFGPDGGLSSQERQTFVFHDCPYIKIDVQFAPIREADGRSARPSSQDTITSISRPYLGRPYFD